MGSSKLKQKDVKKVRKEMLEAQDGICPICMTAIETDPVLDHCHKTGHVRAVLHRQCNALLGKIENYVQGYGKQHFSDTNVLRYFLNRTVDYMQDDYTSNPLHYKHQTETDKKVKELRGRLKRAKKECTKKRIRDQIREVQNG